MAPVTEQDVRYGDPETPPTPAAEPCGCSSGRALLDLDGASDGRPHVTPLPAVWHDGRLHFWTGPAEQKAVISLGTRTWRSPPAPTGGWRASTSWSKATPSGVTDDVTFRTLADIWRSKFSRDWDFADEAGTLRLDVGGAAIVFEVAPTRVLGFCRGDFAQTRYRFPRTPTNDAGSGERVQPRSESQMPTPANQNAIR